MNPPILASVIKVSASRKQMSRKKDVTFQLNVRGCTATIPSKCSCYLLRLVLSSGISKINKETCEKFWICAQSGYKCIVCTLNISRKATYCSPQWSLTSKITFHSRSVCSHGLTHREAAGKPYLKWCMADIAAYQILPRKLPCSETLASLKSIIWGWSWYIWITNMSLSLGGMSLTLIGPL